MGRNILFITTDQQRYDALGLQRRHDRPHAGRRRAGRRRASATERAYNQNTVCMPARSTMLTGQYVRTHGVVANGVPLPDRRPVGRRLPGRAGRLPHRAARQGPLRARASTRTARSRRTAGRRGRHRPVARLRARRCRSMHAAAWGDVPLVALRPLAARAPPRAPPQLRRPAPGRAGRRHRRARDQEQPDPAGAGTTPTGWPICTIDWLDALDDDDDWFCWMSFPDPHHPWDPPASELDRVDWRDLDLPPGHPGSDEADPQGAGRASPPHWLAYWEGTWREPRGRPGRLRARRGSPHDQIREINAKTHVMNELIDEAVRAGARPRRRAGLARRHRRDLHHRPRRAAGRLRAALQGPVPHRRAHAAAAGVAAGARRPASPPAVVDDPVGQVDLAPTFCAIAGVEPARVDAGHGRCRSPTASRAASGRCASGTASSPATACTCARSTATAGCAPSTSRRPPASPTGSRRCSATAC